MGQKVQISRTAQKIENIPTPLHFLEQNFDTFQLKKHCHQIKEKDPNSFNSILDHGYPIKCIIETISFSKTLKPRTHSNINIPNNNPLGTNYLSFLSRDC